MRNLCCLLVLLFVTVASAAESLRPYVYRVIGFEVTDGDTIRTELDLGFHFKVNYSARLHGVDAPEVSTAAGKAVRQFVADWCAAQQTLLAVSVAQDKYEGRYVAEIHGDFAQLNELLLERKLAKAYDGGTKTEWTEAELARIEQGARIAIAELKTKKPEADGGSLFGGPAALAPATAKKPTPQLTHWLTAATGVRHKPGCRYYKKSEGRACTASDGKPCKVCGG